MTRQALILLALVLPLLAAAGEKAGGSFTATQRCEAYASFRKQTNPGAVHTATGASYDIKSFNRPGAYSWVQIAVPGADPAVRWVSKDCGNVQQTIATPGGKGGGSGASCHAPNQYDSWVLALSWQSGFCRHYPYKGDKPECDALAAGTLSVDHLTLHGLWPNKASCGIGYDSCASVPLRLSPATRQALQPWVPDLAYHDDFVEHEWSKHGTCQATDSDTYFLTALKAAKVVNDSGAGQYIRAHAGASLSAREFFDKIKADYGAETAAAISLNCGKGSSFLVEIDVNLPATPDLDHGLAAMTRGAPPAHSATVGCGGDRIGVEKP